MFAQPRHRLTIVLVCAVSVCAQSTKIYGLDAHVDQGFAKNKLVRTRYTFKPEHSELNDFIRDFHTVEVELTKKYGTPETDRAIWTDDSTQLEPKSYLDQDRATATGILPSDLDVGLAVSLGHLKMYTQWSTKQAKIRHSLTGADGHVTHQLEIVNVN